MALQIWRDSGAMNLGLFIVEKATQAKGLVITIFSNDGWCKN